MLDKGAYSLLTETDVLKQPPVLHNLLLPLSLILGIMAHHTDIRLDIPPRGRHGIMVTIWITSEEQLG
jgi:hypothetical protein